MKSHAGKWLIAGVSDKDRDAIYSKLRSRAKSIIIKKYNKSYRRVLKKLIKEELRVLEVLKGGNKKE